MQMSSKPKLNTIEKADVEKVKNIALASYRKQQSIWCPYLKDSIHLNVSGIEHIEYRRRRKPRPLPDQYIRFKLLYLAPEVIGLSHTVQGMLTRDETVREKVAGTWCDQTRNVKYWEFVHIIGSVRIKIIVMQVGGGSKVFRSIIPFWRTDTKERTRIVSDRDIDDDS